MVSNACYMSTDIKDSFNHVACIDDYAMLKLIYTCNYLNYLQMIALLEMVCVTY